MKANTSTTTITIHIDYLNFVDQILMKTKRYGKNRSQVLSFLVKSGVLHLFRLEDAERLPDKSISFVDTWNKIRKTKRLLMFE